MSRRVLAFTVLLTVWLLTPEAWAQCPDDGECMTAREAHQCLVCLDEVDDLRAEARRVQALVNQERGRVDELRLRVQALRVERDDHRDQARDAKRRPGWTVVIGVGLGALVAGGVVGVVAF